MLYRVLCEGAAACSGGLLRVRGGPLRHARHCETPGRGPLCPVQDKTGASCTRGSSRKPKTANTWQKGVAGSSASARKLGLMGSKGECWAQSRTLC